MKNMKLLIRRFFLVCYDVCAVLASCLLALLSRFDFHLDWIPSEYLDMGLRIFWVASVITLISFAIFRLYSSLWSYAGTVELMYISCACFVDTLVLTVYVLVGHGGKSVYPMPRSFYFFYGIFLLILTVVGRYSYRLLRMAKGMLTGQKDEHKNVLIVGAGSAGDSLIKEIVDSKYINMHIVGAVDDDVMKRGSYIHGIKVYGGRHMIPDLVEILHVHEIIIAIPSAPAKKMRELLEICKDTGCDLKRLPGMYQLVNGDVSVTKLKHVDVNDLLGRDPVEVDLDSIMGYVSGQVVMVTGGGGSIGSELCRQIAGHKPKKLVIVDIYENNAYEIQQELKHNNPNLDLVVLIASVRNTNRMNDIFRTYKPDIVYHAAAHKHVPLMEVSPNEAIKNNVFGTLKTARAAGENGVKRFVMISTDKAVNPTNIMGASKRICEMIIQVFNNRYDTEFVAVRFGNVLGSNGSVIPLFKKQIEQGGPVTVTHPDIIRYFMTIPEAVSLVLQAGAYAKGGEIFVLDMGEPVKIYDLAVNLIRLSGYTPNEDIMITFTGLRPGEKLYEEMLMDEEGLQDTDNHMIHIGKPMEIDEEQFEKNLDKLGESANEEGAVVRELVQRIVPTYQYGRTDNNSN